jgi:ParB-like chromosome segregation protein Spo0J
MGFKGNLKQLSKLRSIAPNGSRERIDNVIKLYEDKLLQYKSIEAANIRYKQENEMLKEENKLFKLLIEEHSTISKQLQQDFYRSQEEITYLESQLVELKDLKAIKAVESTHEKRIEELTDVIADLTLQLERSNIEVNELTSTLESNKKVIEELTSFQTKQQQNKDKIEMKLP